MKRFRLKVAALAILMIPISSDADFEPHCSGLPAPVLENETIAVVTLNLAHGRGLSFNQMFTTTRKIESNLQQVALLLNRIDADAVALQEADAASKWSGNFDHVQFLKTETGYTCKAHGKHADSWLYNYGTALLARSRFTRVVTHNFEPSPPTTPKGFTMGVVDWNPGGRLSEPVSLRLFSIHLDYSRQSVRESQIAEISEQLDAISPPFVLMGDFNLEWEDSDGLLKEFAKANGLVAWKPESADLGTYDDGKKRLDWILISNDLEFRSYENFQEPVSDHLPVFAELAFAP